MPTSLKGYQPQPDPPTSKVVDFYAENRQQILLHLEMWEETSRWISTTQLAAALEEYCKIVGIEFSRRDHFWLFSQIMRDGNYEWDL